jgi:hypothetical protein
MFTITLRRTLECVTLVTAVLAGRAQAGPTFASHVGGTCVPDSNTIRLGLHETAGFGVRFSGTHTGQIRVLCPFGIDTFGAKLSGMLMSVIDTDGRNLNGRVVAHLRRARHGTNIAVTLVTCDSNTSKLEPPNAGGPQEIFCPLPARRGDRPGWWRQRPHSASSAP